MFDALATRSTVPLLGIVEVCVAEARRLGLRRLALLGTRFTMEAPFYPDVLARAGIGVVTPDATGRAWVHDRYVGELLKGDFRDESRHGFEDLIALLKERERVEGVILGGTELPLLLKSPLVAGLPMLDTTELHVAAIVRRLRSSESRADA